MIFRTLVQIIIEILLEINLIVMSQILYHSYLHHTMKEKIQILINILKYLKNLINLQKNQAHTLKVKN